jgi:hypothetical protein
LQADSWKRNLLAFHTKLWIPGLYQAWPWEAKS